MNSGAYSYCHALALTQRPHMTSPAANPPAPVQKWKEAPQWRQNAPLEASEMVGFPSESPGFKPRSAARVGNKYGQTHGTYLEHMKLVALPKSANHRTLVRSFVCFGGLWFWVPRHATTWKTHIIPLLLRHFGAMDGQFCSFISQKEVGHLFSDCSWRRFRNLQWILVGWWLRHPLYESQVGSSQIRLNFWNCLTPYDTTKFSFGQV